MCLVLGPPNVGKSLLLEKLDREESLLTKSRLSDSAVATKKAVINCGKKNEAVIVEPEKCSFACWSKYLTPQCAAILYMIDSTNRRQISRALILLLKVLSFPATQHVPVLILLNKCDQNKSMSRREVEAYFHLKDIVRCTTSGKKEGHSVPTLSALGQCALNVAGCLLEAAAQNASPSARQVNVLECSSLDGTGVQLILSWLQQNATQR